MLFNLLIWLGVGFAAGAIAKYLTPQDEKGGWISSIIIGIIGSTVGGFLAGVVGLRGMLGTTILGDLIMATGGAFLILWVYHKYLKDKLNLPI
ncbi:MAG: GlsB/YeaQ/YmgE family stress response membrane protein [Bacteroidota bacterium]